MEKQQEKYFSHREGMSKVKKRKVYQVHGPWAQGGSQGNLMCIVCVVGRCRGKGRRGAGWCWAQEGHE